MVEHVADIWVGDLIVHALFQRKLTRTLPIWQVVGGLGRTFYQLEQSRDVDATSTMHGVLRVPLSIFAMPHL